MKRLAGALTVLTVAAFVPLAAFAATPHKSSSAVLHVTAKYKNNMAFKHVMASAKLTYTAHDVVISLTTDNLPKPSTLGKRVYVAFASDGHMTARVGALKTTGNMAGIKAMVMMSSIQDLYVYAENSPTVKHPQGINVLSAMVH